MVKWSEDRRAYMKEWKSKNRDRVRSYSREYHARNRNRINEQHRARARKRYVHDKEAIKKSSREYYARNKNRARENFLKRKYGLTLAAWAAMFGAQGEKCACCGSADPGTKRGWHTDHSHKNGHVRGILCQPCNSALGHAGEDPARLLAAARYLMLG